MAKAANPGTNARAIRVPKSPKSIPVASGVCPFIPTITADAGRPIANRAAVSSAGGIFAVRRRPRTVPSPHNTAAPTAYRAGASSLTLTSNGSEKEIR